VAEGEVLVLRQEMTIARDAFFAVLSAAVPGGTFEVAGQEIGARDGERRLRIVLAPLPDLCLGALRLPRHGVEVWLAGFDAAATARFVERFELAFRRAGG
jgi:hypothetical protein